MSKVVYEDRNYQYIIKGGEHYPPHVHVKDKKDGKESLTQFHSGGRCNISFYSGNYSVYEKTRYTVESLYSELCREWLNQNEYLKLHYESIDEMSYEELLQYKEYLLKLYKNKSNKILVK